MTNKSKNINDQVDEVIANVETGQMLKLNNSEWRSILAKERGVYVRGENCLGKPFDSINYRFCDVDEAKLIVEDNLYALLRYKYFKKTNNDIDDKIKDIVTSFKQNLKTTLIKLSLATADKNPGTRVVEFLKVGEVAFRNGVYDFKKGDWSFKYDISFIKETCNTIYLYSNNKIITWYFDFDFHPEEALGGILNGISINDLRFEDFVTTLKDYTSVKKNYCFELCYNIAHDPLHHFDMDRMKHLAQILGFTLDPEFVQQWVMLIGSGSNGKNSLFDGCFTSKVLPKPAAQSLEDLEEDRFVSGSLINHAHNIYLEASQKTHTESKNLKNLTGSLSQTIESKGKQKYTSIINCKYIFSCNSQGNLKFSDNSTGFRRRINVFEIFYEWDAQKRFLKHGDYYDTNFSDDLRELTRDIDNTIIYIYLGMYGLKMATDNFEKSFKFTYNDWNSSYSDADTDLKELIEKITIDDIVHFINISSEHRRTCNELFYDYTGKKKLFESDSISDYNVTNYDIFVDNFLPNPENTSSYFAEYDVLMNVKLLQRIAKVYQSDPNKFTTALKKLYPSLSLIKCGANKNYVKVGFRNGRLKILNE